MIEKEPISLQKCPNCGHEPVDGCTTCPKCGFSLQLNDQLNTENITDKNDTIEWSELADMPIESVQKMFKDNEEKMKEEHSKETEETPELNPILAQYIREHKDSLEEQDESNNEMTEDTVVDNEENTDETQISNEETEESPSESILSPNPIPEYAESEEDAEEVEAMPLTEDASIEESSEAIEEERTIETETDSDKHSMIPVDSTEAGNGGSIPPEAPRSTGDPQKKGGKKRYITLAAIVVLGVGGGYYYQHEKKVEAQQIATVKKENKALDSIEASIAGYYTNEKQTFIAADKLDLNTSKIDEELAGYKDNKRYDKLKKEYNELVEKQKAEKSVNQLFKEAAINGDKVTDKPLLKSAEPVTLTVDTGDQEFDQLMNQAINNAKDQYTKIEAAKKAADGLLKDGNVIDSVNRDQYNSANDAVKVVANQSLVQTQKDELAKVDQTLKEKEKKAAEEKAAAEKAAQEKAEQEKAAREAQNSNSSSASNQAGDTSSDAYAWAPGVKEKVIQTCISRGYIVDGGYSLEPVKVENGEGYYNLYATSNRASLTKGYSNSDLPMYLVTINCKTGWFKGNGPN